MSPNYTPKEAEVYERFQQGMMELQKNPNQSLGTYVEQVAKKKTKTHGSIFSRCIMDLGSIK